MFPNQTYFQIENKAGSCEHDTFLCDNDDIDGGAGDFKCLPLHLLCERIDACREKHKVVCGLFYGHIDYIESNISDTKSVPLDTTESYSPCGM